MTSRRTLLASLIPFPLFAADFWQVKKPADWSDKEIKKLLTNSPWSQDQTVELVGKTKTSTNKKSSSNSNARNGGAPTRSTTAEPKTSIVRITCASAKPVKIAIARKNYGADAGSKPEVIAALERVDPYYLITVDGIPSHASSKGPRGIVQLVQSTSVLKCAGKSPRLPNKVEIMQGEIGTLALITFTKENPFTEDDKEVEFQLELGSKLVTKKFKLKDMVFDGKLEM